MKSKLIILDADVVIHLHELGIWKDFIQKYEVHLTSIVISECKRFKDPSLGENSIPFEIDLDLQIENGSIYEESLDASILIDVNSKLEASKCPSKPEIHPGELEILAFEYNKILKDCHLCIADKGAIFAATILDLDDNCISLQKALEECGLSKQVNKQFRDEWLKKWIAKAQTEKIYDL